MAIVYFHFLSLICNVLAHSVKAPPPPQSVQGDELMNKADKEVLTLKVFKHTTWAGCCGNLSNGDWKGKSKTRPNRIGRFTKLLNNSTE